MYKLILKRTYITLDEIVKCNILINIHEKPHNHMRIIYKGLKAQLNHLEYDIINNVWIDTCDWEIGLHSISIEKMTEFGWNIESVKPNLRYKANDKHYYITVCDSQKPY